MNYYRLFRMQQLVLTLLSFQIKFSIITFNILLIVLQLHYEPSRSLLMVSRTNTNIVNNVLCHYGFSSWEKLPKNIRPAPTLICF